MCGIAGYWNIREPQPEDLASIVTKMGAALAHRGPDADSAWVDSGAGIGMSHRRLSIVDLTSAGMQPMTSADGNLVIVFNGEIYNHADLRSTFGRGWTCRGHSDTETLLELISSLGIQQALDRCRGMFAFALWNRHARELVLARDRIGEKPLYFAVLGDTVIFGSELRAMRVHPRFPSEIDPAARALFFHLGYIPAPWSVWKGVAKVLPGETVTLSVGRDGFSVAHRRYWTLSNAIHAGLSAPFSTIDEAETEIADALTLSVREQLQADVPVGILRSGGIDSALVSSTAARLSGRRLMTFTIGHFDERYDESLAARRIGSHLGTEHRELKITIKDALEIIDQLPQIYDEPLADSSAIPTILVSRLAQQHVKVVLSGDGGDEFFGGYRSYSNPTAMRHWRALRRIPSPLRRLMVACANGAAPTHVDDVLAHASKALGVRWRHSIQARCELSAALAESRSVANYFRTCSAKWTTPPLQPTCPVPQWDIGDTCELARADPIRVMMAIDASSVLPGDILAKVDRAAMSTGLEVRIPLLDQRIVELALRIPTAFNVGGGRGKLLLRNILSANLPKEITELPKRGFGIPIGDWLRGPLRERAESMLSESALGATGALNPSPIRTRWKLHLEGRCDFGASLWTVLTWQNLTRATSR